MKITCFRGAAGENPSILCQHHIRNTWVFMWILETTCGTYDEHMWNTWGRHVEDMCSPWEMWNTCGTHVERMWNTIMCFTSCVPNEEHIWNPWGTHLENLRNTRETHDEPTRNTGGRNTCVPHGFHMCSTWVPHVPGKTCSCVVCVVIFHRIALAIQILKPNNIGCGRLFSPSLPLNRRPGQPLFNSVKHPIQHQFSVY